jgi:dolichyl-phosphate beta-glucosyltransferase
VNPPTPSLSIIIPAFDEEARLPRLLELLDATAEEKVARCRLSFLETVIVDDGSADRTAAILTETAGRKSTLRAVVGRGHRGKGAAVAAGLRAARGDYALLADVDLSTPLDDLGQLADAIRQGADIAVGSRDMGDPKVVQAPLHRRHAGRAFRVFVRALTGLDLSDTQCGFKLMRAAVGREITNDQLCEGFAFDVELLVRARAAGLRIAEVPVSYIHDPRSRVRLATASPRMLFDVARIGWRSRRHPQPDRATGGSGAA